MREVEQRILSATSSSPQEGGAEHPRRPEQNATGPHRTTPAGALLFVSGSHPVRSLPGVNRALASSLDSLKVASNLRSRGLIPPTTQFWAVSNPNIERDASRLEKKVANGATVILTQPAFDAAAFDSWLSDAVSRGLNQQAKILVGMPLISSPGNLAFWLSLANCTGSARAQELLREFQAAAMGCSKAAFAEYCLGYNRDLARQLLGSVGVAGLHIMPITAASKRMALQLMPELTTFK